MFKLTALSAFALFATTVVATPVDPTVKFAPRDVGLKVRDEEKWGSDYGDHHWDNECKDGHCEDKWHWDESSCITGYLKLTTLDGHDYGFVSKHTTYYGAYVTAKGDDDKLLVQIDESQETSGFFNIKTLNGPDKWSPFLAGIVGFSTTNDDIGVGSYNYFYIGGAAYTTLPYQSAQTIPNTYTSWTWISRNVETAIFHAFDKETKCFDVQWFNYDLSSPETFVGVYEEDGSCAIFGTGDKDVFTYTFGKATFVKISFHQADK